MPLDKNLRVTYIRDPNNSERVLTIVRRLNKDNTVTFGTSVNKPTTWVARHESRHVKILGRVPGDNFSKKKGRAIAVARLHGRGSVTLEVEEGSSPYLTILKYLMDESDRKVARIAANELLYLSFLDSLMDDSGFLDDEEDDYIDRNGN